MENMRCGGIGSRRPLVRQDGARMCKGAVLPLKRFYPDQPFAAADPASMTALPFACVAASFASRYSSRLPRLFSQPRIHLFEPASQPKTAPAGCQMTTAQTVFPPAVFTVYLYAVSSRLNIGPLATFFNSPVAWTPITAHGSFPSHPQGVRRQLEYRASQKPMDARHASPAGEEYCVRRPMKRTAVKTRPAMIRT